MQKGFFYILAVLVTLTFSSCDMVKSFFGMPTSEDVANMKMKEEAAARERFMQDSLDRIQAREEERKAAELALEEARSRTLFHVITGSFRYPENAEKMLSLLKKEGYEPELILFPNGYHVVSAFSSESFREASRKMEEIKERAFCPYDIWIHKQQPEKNL